MKTEKGFVTLDNEGYYWGRGKTKAESFRSARNCLKESGEDDVILLGSIPCDPKSYSILKKKNSIIHSEWSVWNGVFYANSVIEEIEADEQRKLTRGVLAGHKSIDDFRSLTMDSELPIH